MPEERKTNAISNKKAGFYLKNSTRIRRILIIIPESVVPL